MSTLQFPDVDALISQFEGFGQPGLSITNGNNPGAIMAGAFATANGAIGTSPNGTAIFPDTATGLAATDALVSSKISAGLVTPEQLINAWAPGNAPGNTSASTAAYINSVAAGLGIAPTDPIPGASTPGNSVSALPTNTVTSPSAFDSINNSVTQALNGFKTSLMGGTVLPTGQGTSGSAFDLSGVSFARILTAVIGAGLVLGGIFFLRPVQQGVTTIVRTSTKAARLVTG